MYGNNIVLGDTEEYLNATAIDNRAHKFLNKWSRGVRARLHSLFVFIFRHVLHYISCFQSLSQSKPYILM